MTAVEKETPKVPKKGNGEKGESVKDYMIMNQERWNKIVKFRIGKRTESDHQPLEQK